MFKNSTGRFGRVKFAIGMESPYPNPPAPPDAYYFNTTNGYVCGGRSTGAAPANSYNRATYSTEVTATNSNTLGAARYKWSQNCGNATKGYVGGGDTDTGGGSPSRAIDRYTYGTDSSSTLTATLVATLRYRGGGGGSNTEGYFLGGRNAGNTADILTSDKLVYSTEATSAGPTLTNGYGVRASGNGTKLYIFAKDKSVDKLTYATSTISNAASVTVQNRAIGAIRTAYAYTTVYMFGGENAASSYKSAEKFTMSSETSAAISALTFGFDIHEGTSMGSTTKVYNLGGFDTTYSLRCQAITTSSDTQSAVTGMNTVNITIWTAGL